MPPVLVKHLMHAPVVALLASQTLSLADDIMQFRHVRHLPVIDDAQHVVGLVSHRDLLRAQVSSRSAVRELDRSFRQHHIPVAEIMTRDVRTVPRDMLASAAGEILLAQRFGCLPVVDDAQRLVGIVTEFDYLQLAIKAIAMHDP